MDATIQVRQRGTLTLPADRRENYHADPIDLPILASAVQSGCPWLVSFNLHHYRPRHPAVTVLPPGGFLLRVRDLLTRL